jgi:hypothetical protein
MANNAAPKGAAGKRKVTRTISERQQLRLKWGNLWDIKRQREN